LFRKALPRFVYYARLQGGSSGEAGAQSRGERDDKPFIVAPDACHPKSEADSSRIFINRIIRDVARE